MTTRTKKTSNRTGVVERAPWHTPQMPVSGRAREFTPQAGEVDEDASHAAALAAQQEFALQEAAARRGLPPALAASGAGDERFDEGDFLASHDSRVEGPLVASDKTDTERWATTPATKSSKIRGAERTRTTSRGGGMMSGVTTTAPLLLLNTPEPFGDRQPVTGLREYLGRHRRGVDDTLAWLQSVGFREFREIRGDGNCYYRSVALGILETLVSRGATSRLAKLLETFKALDVSKVTRESFDKFTTEEEDDESKDQQSETQAHNRLLDLLEVQITSLTTTTSAAGDEYNHTERGDEARRAMVDRLRADPGLDLALVRVARCLVLEFLAAHLDSTVDEARADLIATRDAFLDADNDDDDKKGCDQASSKDDGDTIALDDDDDDEKTTHAFDDEPNREKKKKKMMMMKKKKDRDTGASSELSLRDALGASEGGAEAVLAGVATLGTDAEGLVCDLAVLPRLMGGGSVTWALFDTEPRPLASDADAETGRVARPGAETKTMLPVVHVVLNPGHYFVLYPEDDRVGVILPEKEDKIEVAPRGDELFSAPRPERAPSPKSTIPPTVERAVREDHAVRAKERRADELRGGSAAATPRRAARRLPGRERVPPSTTTTTKFTQAFLDKVTRPALIQFLKDQKVQMNWSDANDAELRAYVRVYFINAARPPARESWSLWKW